MVMSQEFARLVAMVVLALAPWPVYSALFKRPLWQAFPRAMKLSLIALSGYFAGIALIIFLAPSWVLYLTCISGAIALTGLLFYSRAGYGHSRGWPPGSLRPLRTGPLIEKSFFREQYQQLGSPFKSVHFFRPVFCVVGLAEGLEFLRTHESSLGTPPLPFGRFIPGGFLRYMTPEKHEETKAVLRKTLTRDIFEPLEPFMRDHIRACLGQMTEASACSRSMGVAPRGHVQRLVFTLWARLFFNVIPARGELDRLRSLYKVIDARNPSGASDAAVRSAIGDIKNLLGEQLARYRAAGGDAPGSFLEAIDARCPGFAEDPTVIGNLIYLMHTSWSDISGLLVWVMRMLTDHPQCLAELRKVNGNTGAAGSNHPDLATRIVMETLRLEQSEYLYRVTRKNIEHKGFRIPRGWMVRLCVNESHRDPLVFDRPDDFCPDRFLHHTFNRNQYSPFGAGMRRTCLGEQLSLMVGRIFVEELGKLYQWETTADGPFEFSMWRHWRPSSRWRVLMAKAA